MINLVQKIISAAANRLSCANRVRYIKAYTRKWKKKRDVPQPTLIQAPQLLSTAFTELGGAEPLVEVLNGCEELSCSQYSALNNSTYPNTILYGGIYRQTTETRSRIGQTPNYSECLVRTHPSLTGPGMAILCIKCN